MHIRGRTLQNSQLRLPGCIVTARPIQACLQMQTPLLKLQSLMNTRPASIYFCFRQHSCKFARVRVDWYFTCCQDFVCASYLVRPSSEVLLLLEKPMEDYYEDADILAVVQYLSSSSHLNLPLWWPATWQPWAADISIWSTCINMISKSSNSLPWQASQIIWLQWSGSFSGSGRLNWPWSIASCAKQKQHMFSNLSCCWCNCISSDSSNVW